MDFKLKLDIPPFPVALSYTDSLLLLGSCFAENIGRQLQENKFNAWKNPHGILYNPLNIVHSINECLANKKYTAGDLFHTNDTWSSFHHHSRFSSPDKEKTLLAINNSIQQAHEQLKTVKWIVFTFGSAFIYRKKEDGNYVANCHKIPQQELVKELVSAEQILDVFFPALQAIQQINPQVSFIFTVSPVRYIRDGIIENNVSKGILLQAVHAITTAYSNCFYFPAYEIVNDELRDYRFFKEDFVHPNDMALKYVWERFTETAFSEATRNVYERIQDILKAAQHKPFNPETEAHLAFKAAYRKKILQLKREFPGLQLGAEEEYFGRDPKADMLYLYSS